MKNMDQRKEKKKKREHGWMHVRKFREIKIVLGAIENALATGFILFTVNSFVKVSLAPFT